MLSYILLFRVTLLTNFDFYLCLRVNWVPISQKVGSLSQSLGVPISFRDEQAIFVPFSHTDGDWDGGEDYSPKQASTNPNSKASIEGA